MVLFILDVKEKNKFIDILNKLDLFYFHTVFSCYILQNQMYIYRGSFFIHSD